MLGAALTHAPRNLRSFVASHLEATDTGIASVSAVLTGAPPRPPPKSPATRRPQSPSASASGGDECGGAVARITAAVSTFPEVTKVTMVAACGEASIGTTLPAGVLGSPSAATGVKLCTAAAAVAYQGDVSSVTVESIDGHELAIGLKGADCIP